MLRVSPILRSEIDSWTVAESGLPVRVVNSVSGSNVATVGQLRTLSDENLLSLRSFGRISLSHVRNFFKLCNQIEQGKQAFQTIQEVVSIFLDADELKVITGRYGFDLPDVQASRNATTLQALGDSEHKTRERIRQVEETAKKKLQSRMAKVCLQPFYDEFGAFIESCGKTACCTDLTPLQNSALLSNWNACGVLLLMSDINPGRISFYRQSFSTLPESVLREIESRAFTELGRHEQPTSLDEMLESLIPADTAMVADEGRRAAACILEHSPEVAVTVDRRYFLFAAGTQVFLAEIMKDITLPAHYRAVTQLFNERVKSESRKGAGFILDMLNSNPRCTRVDRGIFDLKAV